MKCSRKSANCSRRGFALLISLIFVLVFSALAISMATVSGTNAQVADNLCKANRARASAESGLEITRFWLSNVSISGNTPESLRYYEVISSLCSYVVENSSAEFQYVGGEIVIPAVTLDAELGLSFSATIHQIDLDTLQLNVTGLCDSFTRTISVNYEFGTRAHTVFDYGVATRGPLALSGNIELDGVNVSIESSVYIESPNSALALSIIGNSQIAGDVKIANPLASVDLQGGQAGIGGETGQAAIDNHVEFGAPETEFPEPDPSHFEPYITNVMDVNTDTSSDVLLENIRIPAGMNPTFSGNTTIRGVIFIDTPNQVRFTGPADVIGVVVGDGDILDNSGTNVIEFSGNVSSSSVSELPHEPQFADLRDETGTFAMAPGFHVSFGGTFDTINGAIAGNGIEFFGNAGGNIGGSIINYSDEEMELSGNSDLFFNRSGLVEVPAGFVPEIILVYDPGSYSEM